MTNNDTNLLDKVEKTVDHCIENSELFLSVQDDLCEELKNTTKCLYDLAHKKKFIRNSTSEALPELIIKDFDIEQIWQQIEIENNEEFDHFSLAEFTKILATKPKFDLIVEFESDSEKSEHSDNGNEEGNDQEKENNSEESDNVSEKSENSFTIKQDKVKTVKTHKKSKKYKKSEVDDKFFKLHQLDEYLNKEDKRETNASNDKISSDEESIDLFNDFSDLDDEEDEEDGDEDDEMGNRKCIKYADFFDTPESEKEDEGNEYEDNAESSLEKNQEGLKGRMTELEEDQGDESEDNEDFKSSLEKSEIEKPQTNKQLKRKLEEIEEDDEGNESEKNEENKSSLEQRQERLKKRITQLEKQAISEKPWQLMGEATATNRPQNSLLEEFVEFDSATRPAPVMTEQTTMKLEDIIVKRIKDKAWDDVEKKFKPVETPREYKKKLIMNQEKSKESLAQIYENEYVKQREALNPDNQDEQEKEEPPDHIEIKQRMHDLFGKLDALSNFHYTPKMAKPEIKIISNVPAISMEEVAPVAASDAAMLAPEEIHSKHKGELIGKSERTKTDMKRERRKKKVKQHLRAVNQQKKLDENMKLKKSKHAVSLGKLKGRNIIETNENRDKIIDKSLKTSTAFFSHLQDQVESTIKQKKSKDTKKKNKNALSAVKLKL